MQVDIFRKVFSSVPKTFGPWENDGVCVGTGQNPACGPGRQTQTRTCSDGTLEKCGDSDDTERSVSCSAAGTSLVACPRGNFLQHVFG